MLQYASKATKPATELEIANDLLEIMPVLLRELRSELRLNSELGVTAPQFRILAAVHGEPRSNKFIAGEIGVNVATTSRMVQQLVDRGFLEKSACAERPKEIRIAQSRAGQMVFEQVRSELRGHFAKRFAALSPEDRLRLDNGLQVLLQVFAQFKK